LPAFFVDLALQRTLEIVEHVPITQEVYVPENESLAVVICVEKPRLDPVDSSGGNGGGDLNPRRRARIEPLST
jgi:hypothetical protein